MQEVVGQVLELPQVLQVLVDILVVEHNIGEVQLQV